MVSGKPGLREMERVVVPWLFHEAQHNLPAAGGRGEAMARSVALSGDGRLAVSASDDQTLEVWDLASGSELRISTGHSSVVTAVAVTADGLRAVSASYDGTLKLWDLETGNVLATFIRDSEAYCCAYSDGRAIDGDLHAAPRKALHLPRHSAA